MQLLNVSDFICTRHHRRSTQAQHYKQESNCQLPYWSGGISDPKCPRGRFARHIATIETRLVTFPSAVPHGISDVFHDALGEARDILKGSDQTVEQ